MRPIRQRRTPKPAVEPPQEPAGSTGNSKVLVWAMIIFLFLGFVCLGLAFFLIDPSSRFGPPWSAFTFGRLMGLSTIFMAMSVMVKGVIQIFRR
ncbi:MAG TPA: hypothetical protein VF789_32225 [Thermoanaerobaculia bacterium]